MCEGSFWERNSRRILHFRLGPRDDTGDEPLIASLCLFQNRRDVIDRWVRSQHRLDFAQFHAESAHFHLVVLASQKFHDAFGQPPREIASPVEAEIRFGSIGSARNRSAVSSGWFK